MAAMMGGVLPAGHAMAQGAEKTPEPAEPAAARRHVEAARIMGGDDMAAIADGFLCRSPEQGKAYLAPIVTGKEQPAPAAAFDNLYYVGAKFVGVWVLRTSQGLVLIDAMWNEKDAREVIEPGMRALGLDPRAVKHVIVTHGHVDHYGGAKHFQAAYGAKVWASAEDWKTIIADPHPLAKGVTPPKRDQIAANGGALTLGDATIRFVLTPGHTPGTLSLLIPVQDGGQQHIVSLWGGTAMPETAAGVRQMHASLLKLWRAGEDAGAEGEISSHGFVDDSFGRFARKAGAEHNPFDLGRDGYARAMGIHSECILAQAARFEAWGR
ncbi:MAG: MBL fold metallo-hydrolase [Sphingobium sp.]|nr:MBL fold metallo-hydrolase [Sphingobium sp.]